MELYCDGFAGSYAVHVVDFLLQYKHSSIFKAQYFFTTENTEGTEKI